MRQLHSFGLFGALCFVNLFVGCKTDDLDEVDDFKAALPLTESVRVDGPETADELANDVENATAVDVPIATYYRFTRKVRDDVNEITRAVLGSVWFVAQTRPTHILTDEVIWGPSTDALEPATYRFRMTKESDGAYHYTYEGRPRKSSSDGDYQTVVDGVGYGKADARHGDGWFTIDLDVAKVLDPMMHENDSGSIRVEHDLPVTVTSQVGALPRHIAVEALRTDTNESYDILSDAHEDNTGTLVVSARADLEPTGLTALENVTVASQWNSEGEGRADVSIHGGDVPTAYEPISLVECWGPTFKRSYYHDSAGIEDDYGTVTACVYSTAID